MLGFNLWLSVAHIELGTNDSSNSRAVHLTISSSASQQSFSTMAYTDEAVRSKLSALNETQEGIVTVAQWIMFHRCVCSLSFMPDYHD